MAKLQWAKPRTNCLRWANLNTPTVPTILTCKKYLAFFSLCTYIFAPLLHLVARMYSLQNKRSDASRLQRNWSVPAWVRAPGILVDKIDLLSEPSFTTLETRLVRKAAITNFSLEVSPNKPLQGQNLTELTNSHKIFHYRNRTHQWRLKGHNWSDIWFFDDPKVFVERYGCATISQPNCVRIILFVQRLN